MIKNKSRISTVDHKDIQTWASTRQMRPTRLKKFGDEKVLDRLKFRFPTDLYPDEEDLTWDTFFEVFDQENLEFVMEDIADQAVEDGNVYQFQPREAY